MLKDISEKLKNLQSCGAMLQVQDYKRHELVHANGSCLIPTSVGLDDNHGYLCLLSIVLRHMLTVDWRLDPSSMRTALTIREAIGEILSAFPTDCLGDGTN